MNTRVLALLVIIIAAVGLWLHAQDRLIPFLSAIVGPLDLSGQAAAGAGGASIPPASVGPGGVAGGSGPVQLPPGVIPIVPIGGGAGAPTIVDGYPIFPLPNPLGH